jgi:hypothetical protein
VEENYAYLKEWQKVFPGNFSTYEYHFYVHQYRDPGLMSMSRRLYEVCTSPHKKLTLIPGAGHGLAFPKNRELYWASLREFEAEWRQG